MKLASITVLVASSLLLALSSVQGEGQAQDKVADRFREAQEKTHTRPCPCTCRDGRDGQDGLDGLDGMRGPEGPAIIVPAPRPGPVILQEAEYAQIYADTTYEVKAPVGAGFDSGKPNKGKVIDSQLAAVLFLKSDGLMSKGIKRLEAPMLGYLQFAQAGDYEVSVKQVPLKADCMAILNVNGLDLPTKQMKLRANAAAGETFMSTIVRLKKGDTLAVRLNAEASYAAMGAANGVFTVRSVKLLALGEEWPKALQNKVK